MFISRISEHLRRVTQLVVVVELLRQAVRALVVGEARLRGRSGDPREVSRHLEKLDSLEWPLMYIGRVIARMPKWNGNIRVLTIRHKSDIAGAICLTSDIQHFKSS